MHARNGALGSKGCGAKSVIKHFKFAVQLKCLQPIFDWIQGCLFVMYSASAIQKRYFCCSLAWSCCVCLELCLGWLDLPPGAGEALECAQQLRLAHSRPYRGMLMQEAGDLIFLCTCIIS